MGLNVRMNIFLERPKKLLLYSLPILVVDIFMTEFSLKYLKKDCSRWDSHPVLFINMPTTGIQHISIYSISPWNFHFWCNCKNTISPRLVEKKIRFSLVFDKKIWNLGNFRFSGGNLRQMLNMILSFQNLYWVFHEIRHFLFFSLARPEL